MSAFEKTTGVLPWDCVITGTKSTRRIVFVLKESMKVELLRKIQQQLKYNWSFSHPVEVVTFHPKAEAFLKNFLIPVEIKNLKIKNTEQKTTYLSVAREDRGKVIGKKGSRIICLRMLLIRYFGIERFILVK